MTYVPLGSRYALGAADTTGLNPGNITIAFTTNIVDISIANFELYHAVITNVVPGITATIYLGTRVYSFTGPQGGSEWDPSQPMLLIPGQEFYFCTTQAAGLTPVPTVTAYFRYDPSLPGNQS